METVNPAISESTQTVVSIVECVGQVGHHVLPNQGQRSSVNHLSGASGRKLNFLRSPLTIVEVFFLRTDR